MYLKKKKNYLKMKLLINFMVVGCQEDVICNLESARRSVNSSGSQQMVTEKEMGRKEEMTFLYLYTT